MKKIILIFILSLSIGIIFGQKVFIKNTLSGDTIKFYRGNTLLKLDTKNLNLTGVPTAPTAAPGDNSTKIATTAHVKAADDLKLNVANPTATGTLTTPILRVGNAASNTIISVDSIGRVGDAYAVYDGPDTLPPYQTYNGRIDFDDALASGIGAAFNGYILPIPTGVAADTVLVLHNGQIYYSVNSMSAYPRYYVSNTGSDDSTGLTPSQAWATIAKVNATTLTPGTAVYFNRGDEWREELVINQSGTSEAPITITAYGEGAKPIINGANVVTGWHDSYNNVNANIWGTASLNPVPHRMMVVIAGTLYTQVATLAELTAANRYWVNSTSTPDSVYIYSTTSPNTVTAEISAREYCLLSNDRYLNISYLDCRNSGHAGIMLYGSATVIKGYSVIDSVNLYRNRLAGISFDGGYGYSEIKNSSATYNGNNFLIWGQTPPSGHGSGGIGSNYNVFSHCYSAYAIHDYILAGQYSDGTGLQIFNSDSCRIEYCESDHDQEGIFLDAYHNQNLHMIARYNYIHDANAITASYAIGYNDVGTGSIMDIYYNLIVNCGNGGASEGPIKMTATNDGTVNFYNNTVSCDENYGVDISRICYGVHYTGINIANNIFYMKDNESDGDWIYTVISTGFPTSNYNQYYLDGVLGIARYNSTSYNSLAEWQAISSQDANSSVGDPLFTNILSDWTLQAGSPCVNTGTAISGIPNHDILGNPVVGTRDKGCYERQ